MTERIKARANEIKEKAQGWKFWRRGLLKAFISGGATSAVSSMGLVVAEEVGIEGASFSLETVGIIFVSGAVYRTFEYLKNDPLPDLD